MGTDFRHLAYQRRAIYSSAAASYATGCVMAFGSSASKHIIVYLFISIETTSDTTIAARFSTGQKVNDQQNLTGLVELFHRHFVLVDDFCGHASYRHCAKVLSTRNKLPHSSENGYFV